MSICFWNVWKKRAEKVPPFENDSDESDQSEMPGLLRRTGGGDSPLWAGKLPAFPVQNGKTPKGG